MDGEEIFCFFQTAETGNRTPNSKVKGSGASHYPRAPTLQAEAMQFFLILGQSHPKLRLSIFFYYFAFKKFTEIVVDLEKL